MKIILKYKNLYQVVAENMELNGEITFTDNQDDNYIALKNNSQIYRYDKSILIIKLSYATPIGSIVTLIKSPIKEIHKELSSKLKLIDTYYCDDCVLVYINESDLNHAMEILTEMKYGCYASRVKRPIKSIKNLPNYESKRKVLEEIQDTKQYNKLTKMINKVAEKNGKSVLITWKNTYKKFKDEYDIDISELSNISEIKPINIIDSQNLYYKMFKMLDNELRQ